MNASELLESIRTFVSEASDEEIKEFKAQLREAVKVERGAGRKEQVLALLQENGPMSIAELAAALDTTAKNISSQLCYLRKDGHKVGTRSDGRKFLED